MNSSGQELSRLFSWQEELVWWAASGDGNGWFSSKNELVLDPFGVGTGFSLSREGLGLSCCS